MSFDLGVWYSDLAVSAEDAGIFYRHINHDWRIVREHPALRAFCLALIAEFPGMLDPADLAQDFTMPGTSALMTYAELLRPPALVPIPTQSKPEPPPWSVRASFTGCAVTMSLGREKPEICPAIQRLAGVHGLIAYNPQTGDVTLPPHLLDRPCRPLPIPVRMVIEEQIEGLRMRLPFEDGILFDGIAPSRREAHRLAREHTLAMNRLVYEFEDKKLLSFGMLTAAATVRPVGDHFLKILKQMPNAPLWPKKES
jgi:hypothetical protein